jgi:pimeloyl-ACP methyl ester carboxylesterase
MQPTNRLQQAANNLEQLAKYSGQKTFDSTKANRTVQIALRVLENKFLGHQWNPQTHKDIIERMRKSVATIKNNQHAFFQNSQLGLLEEEIDMLIREGMIKKVFHADPISSSLSEHLQAPFRYIFNFLTKRVAHAIRSQIYRGWSQKIKNKKIKELVEKDYQARYKNWYESAKAKAHSTQQLNKVQDIFNDELAHLQSVVERNPQVQEIAELEKKAEETRKLFMDIGGERIQLKTADGVNLDATYLSTNEFKHALQEQNGQQVNYTFSKDIHLSGISINPDHWTNSSLIEKLKRLGLLSDQEKPGSGYALLYDHIAKRSVIASKESLQKLSHTGYIQYDGNEGVYKFAINPYPPQYSPISVAEDFKRQILANGGRLQELFIKGEKAPIPAFSHAQPLVSCPAGFVALNIPDQKGGFRKGTYYIQKDKAEELERTGHLKIQNEKYLWVRPQNVYAAVPKNFNEWNLQQEGVAILSSGNAGVYEMHKGEALSLLMKGCDVMMLNLRGYGGSEGEPSVEGNYHDLEAAYQFVKHHRKGIPDSKITAWALCLSGGMAAHLAEKHPYINLFLNQTYAEFWNIARSTIEEELDHFLRKHIHCTSDRSQLRNAIKKCLFPIIAGAIKLVTPNYNVKDRLSKVKGKICVMQATDDTLMTRAETEQMKAAIKGKRVNCQFVDIPGGHCTPWNQVVIYHNRWTGEEVRPEDFVWTSLDGVNPIFIPIADLHRGWSFTALDGTSYEFLMNNPEDPQAPLILNTYPPGAKRPTSSTFITTDEVTEKELPRWVADLKLEPEFRGHHYVEKFLADTHLGSPLI